MSQTCQRREPTRPKVTSQPHHRVPNKHEREKYAFVDKKIPRLPPMVRFGTVGRTQLWGDASVDWDQPQGRREGGTRFKRHWHDLFEKYLCIVCQMYDIRRK